MNLIFWDIAIGLLLALLSLGIIMDRKLIKEQREYIVNLEKKIKRLEGKS
jgi:hypothetical protein